MEIRDFRAWAKEIARRKVREYFRENKNRKELALPVEEMAEAIGDTYEESIVDQDDIRQRQGVLRVCMDKLTQNQRGLLRLRCVEGEDYRLIATNLGRTETSVRRAVSRLRLTLMECVRRSMARLEPGT